MGNIVAARRLRKSMLNESEFDNDLFNDINYNQSYLLKSSGNENKKNNKINFIKIKTKFTLKVFFSILIIFCCLVVKISFKDKVLKNKYINNLIEEYNKDYSKEYVLNKIEFYCNKLNNNFKYFIPSTITNKLKKMYFNIKPNILNFNLLSNFNKSDITNDIQKIECSDVYNSISENINFDKDLKNNKIADADLKEMSSAVSMMQDDVGEIINKKIDMIKPVTGVITSKFGVRDEIFKNVNSYHTGIDIANKKGTKIMSSTEGKVIEVVKNNKYYGNYICILKNDVIFKYAHLDKINVKINTKVKQGEIIATMGSTGLSTGPHLHFEIKINNRVVDPEKLIKF